MTSELANFAARLREFITFSTPVTADVVGDYEKGFAGLALELFALQFVRNAAYRRICEARRATPEAVTHWTQIPAVPTAAFKEFELTCLPAAERTAVFHSSGTSGQRPSRHFHNSESLALYEASLLPWVRSHLLPDIKSDIPNLRLITLTPPPAQALHSSLVHMFEVVRRELRADNRAFVGRSEADGSWSLDLDAALAALRAACACKIPLALLGAAFSFVQLLDGLAERHWQVELPPGSRVLETGGYKGRSRILPKARLHALITQWLGIPPSHIICEYGMSELGSQAYDRASGDRCRVTSDENVSRHPSPVTRHFHFPPWARVQIISPETGLEVGEGETGLIRVFDLANVFSVLAIQTEDLGIRRGDGFELLGRAATAEPRGCSLMAVNS
ncbi:MAG: hypothetical protein MUF81_17735 [Verrucomicrobia bacterium]|jgi:hypothetical protein|nr:hypothetical protein [Verrucomicrobiota bacterium]